MNERADSEVMSRADADGSDADGEPSTDDQELRRATGLAVAAAGISIFAFVSLFRLRVGWDQSRARAFRRFLGVQAESLAGVALGYRALNRLRSASADKRGLPFAVVGIVLGVSNVVRAVSWLRQDRPQV
jgi:hypothetical protein